MLFSELIGSQNSLSDRTVNAGVVGAFDCVSAWIKSGDRESSKTGVLVRLDILRKA